MLPRQASIIKVSVNIALLGYMGDNGTLEGSIIAKPVFLLVLLLVLIDIVILFDYIFDMLYS